MLRKIFMRNDLSKERFRNEWKYLISTSEKELLELRMKHLLKKDPNAKGNGYMIRSLAYMTVVTVRSSWSGRRNSEVIFIKKVLR